MVRFLLGAPKSAISKISFLMDIFLIICWKAGRCSIQLVTGCSKHHQHAFAAAIHKRMKHRLAKIVPFLTARLSLRPSGCAGDRCVLPRLLGQTHLEKTFEPIEVYEDASPSFMNTKVLQTGAAKEAAPGSKFIVWNRAFAKPSGESKSNSAHPYVASSATALRPALSNQ